MIGSLSVPYIYEDRISQDDFEKAMSSALNASKKSYNKMSTNGMKHVAENYNFEKFEKGWVEIMDNVVERCGSWDSRKGYKRWHLMEVA